MTKVLMIDNYDSFTYNIVQYLKEIGAEVEVIQNDEMGIDEISSENFSHLILSPGAGNPDTAGVCMPALERFHTSKKYLEYVWGTSALRNFSARK